MSLQPPGLAYRLLRRALAGDPAGPAILGDLHEDFIRMAEASGRVRAHLWYWWEALTLSTGRTVQRPHRFQAIWQDARNALRSVRRDRGFALFATLIVGVGVGASTAVFSVMSPLMLAPLPFENPGELVWVANDQEGTSLSSVTSRSSNLRDFRELSRSFSGLSGYFAFFDQSTYNLVGDGEAEQLHGVGVAHDFLDVLGVRPVHGRNFTPEEGMWGGPASVILSHGFWTRRFAGDPNVVGTSITLNDVSREVIGVLPPSFSFSSVFTPTVRVDFLLTFAVSDETDRWGNTMSMIGRLNPGATVEAAQSDLDGVVEGLQEADPQRWGLGAKVTPLQRHIAGPFRAAMLLLAGAAATVMLIVCANLSNMLLARSPKRKREVAIRRTLGATRGRLVRQLMFESLLLSLCGAAVGVAIAVGVTRGVAGTSGLAIPMLRDVSVDVSALLFTAALAVVVGLAIGTIPALQVSEGEEAASLKAGSRRSGAGRGAGRLRDALVVSEIALACVLLVFGGLFLRSFQAVMDIDLGYVPEGVVAWQLNPSESLETLEETTAFFNQITTTVEAIPGVESVGLIDALPLGRNRTWGMRVVGAEYTDEEDGISLFPHIVDPGYLEAMKIPLLSGRRFSPDDGSDTDPVVLINASGADQLFAGSDPVGRFIDTGRDTDWRIVGVVGDVKHQTLELGSGVQIYFSTAQMQDYQTLDMVVRSRLPVEAIAGTVSAALRRLDGGMPTNEYWTLRSTVESATSSRRFTLTLLGAFASTALLLAALGIYGVLSYSVTERIPEIGIRMALGATAADVRRRVVGRTMVLAVLGIAIGMVFSVLGSGLIASLLFGVRPTDPRTFAGMVVVLLAVAAFSGLFPALRASRTDSVTALKG